MCKYISFNEYNENVNNVYLPNERRDINTINFGKEYGNIKINYFNTGLGISYSTFEAKFHEDTILEGVNKNDFSFLSFNLGSNMYMESLSKKDNINFNSNSCIYGTVYKDSISKGYFSKNKNYTAHYITIDNSIYEEILNQEFSSKFEFKGDGFCINSNNKITSQQKQLITDITKNSHLEGKLQEIYLESKLFDLVYMSVNKINSQNKEKNNIYLNSQDIRSLNNAKDILIEDMLNPPSLKELSKKAAINEFKLKKGFKQLFGNTVYGFLQEYRLIEAKRLLETNEVNINEATSLVGYKSVSHFSRIFKEHFGKNPIEIKKESRKYYY